MASGITEPQNVIFWGAGATRALGIRGTDDQQKFLRCITDAEGSYKPLNERVAGALGPGHIKRWSDALFDLITILGDGDDAYSSISNIDVGQLDAMRRNWRPADDEELRKRIIDLRLTYDWPALKSVVRICPGSATNAFRLNDLFNLLDMHIPFGSGVPAPVRKKHSGEKQADDQFLDARRLIGAKNALLMILMASFYIDYQTCIASKRGVVAEYYDFAKVLGRRLQRKGLELAGTKFDRPEFYLGDVGFVSLNYDPIALWVQFVANKELNKSASVPHLGSPAAPLNIFHDFGHLIPARRIEKGPADWPWYPLNEAGAQRLNELESGGSRVMLTKFLFPHGCLCWRECPNCGKLSAYHGDSWDLCSRSLFPPPPLQAFETEALPDWIIGKEREQREKGKVDARKCLHCDALTYAYHTQTVMQSSFKPRPPSFIEEVQRELRAITMRANHIIFIGYSLPLDDVTYRAFFSARSRHDEVRCTVVDKDEKNPGWCGPADIRSWNFDERHDAVAAARDLFGPDKVRFYGGGVPDVFLDAGRATEAKLERLLTWT